jgi:uncharacterized protein (TIGR03435 family)
MNNRKPLLACIMLLLCAATRAQQPTPAAQLPTYDVVSIHPNNSLSGSTHMSTHYGILKFTNVTLKQMLAYAYQIRDGLIDGLPTWADSAHFDIEAKVVDPDMKALEAMDRQQRCAMLIPILADRFGAKVHTETKQLPVYDLVVAKDGPKFKPYVAPAADPPAPAPPAKGPNMGAGSISVNGGKSGVVLTAVGIPMSSLAENLAQQVDKTVLDKTGLTGIYNFEIKYTPDRERMNADATNDQAPDIYTALQEQLGLKLVAGKGPVVTLVVDQIKQPTEN